jgi:hypothetical protein
MRSLLKAGFRGLSRLCGTVFVRIGARRQVCGTIEAEQLDVRLVDESMGATLGGRVLPFPIHGEALLVKLADLLRRRIAEHGIDQHLFPLTLSRAPLSRLRIDRTSFIEFEPLEGRYRMVAELAPSTELTLRTTDFDNLVKLVAEYVNSKIASETALDIAS